MRVSLLFLDVLCAMMPWFLIRDGYFTRYWSFLFGMAWEWGSRVGLRRWICCAFGNGRLYSVVVRTWQDEGQRGRIHKGILARQAIDMLVGSL